MARYRSLRKGKVFKPFKDRRDYQSPVDLNNFLDPPHYKLMPEDVKQKLNQDMNKLSRAEVDELMRMNKKYLKEYNRRMNS
jgi:hypothetical protein